MNRPDIKAAVLTFMLAALATSLTAVVVYAMLRDADVFKQESLLGNLLVSIVLSFCLFASPLITLTYPWIKRFFERKGR